MGIISFKYWNVFCRFETKPPAFRIVLKQADVPEQGHLVAVHLAFLFDARFGLMLLDDRHRKRNLESKLIGSGSRVISTCL
jgi:hypothetical protein